MKTRIFKRTAFLLCAAFIIMMLALPAAAVDYSAGAGAGGGLYETSPVGGNSGGRLGENYNAPAANGGGEIIGGDMDGRGAVDGVYADTTEDGEVLGVMDTESSATAGFVIAILIAVAVIVLIIALIPKGASDT